MADGAAKRDVKVRLGKDERAFLENGVKSKEWESMSHGVRVAVRFLMEARGVRGRQ